MLVLNSHSSACCAPPEPVTKFRHVAHIAVERDHGPTMLVATAKANVAGTKRLAMVGIRTGGAYPCRSLTIHGNSNSIHHGAGKGRVINVLFEVGGATRRWQIRIVASALVEV